MSDIRHRQFMLRTGVVLGARFTRHPCHRHVRPHVSAGRQVGGNLGREGPQDGSRRAADGFLELPDGQSVLRKPESLRADRKAAHKLGMPIPPSILLDAVSADIVESRAQSLGVDFTALTVRESKRIADFAILYRLPSLFGQAESVAAGGHLSYGANRTAIVVHSFTYVDRILRGEWPGELPVELPSRFELAINMVTAKAIGITIPNSVLMRTDRVNE